MSTPIVNNFVLDSEPMEVLVVVDPTSDPVNYAEIGRRHGLTRQRVMRIARSDPDFPPEIARIQGRPIFDGEAVARYFEQRHPRTGRPRKGKGG